MVTHRINRVEFELEVSAVEIGRRVSDRVSVLHGHRLPGLLDRVFSEVDDSQHIDRIDTLELDLGVITLANFDDDLLAKLEAALRLALRGRPKQPARAQDDSQADAHASRAIETPDRGDRTGHARELLDCYAWTGSLPWWADARERGLIAQHMQDLLMHAPASWLELLREHADDRVGLDRLARACDDELFEVIVERAGAAESLPDLRALVHLLSLAGVRSESGRTALLGELARLARLESSTVLPTVLRELDGGVLITLGELLSEHPALGTVLVRRAITNALPRANQDLGLRGTLDRSDELEAAEPTTVSAQPEQRGDSTPLADDPTSAAEHAVETSDAPELAAATTTSPSAAPDPQHPEHLTPRRAVRAPHPPPSAKLQLARQRALARLDEFYIEDAGLVILWPFLERLFTRVELLDERRFIDEAAQTRAIALLAYLALDDPEPPEHRLAFSKLLCGRPPEQPCEFDGPLDAALCDECDHMLAAVIDHAPVLDAMPIHRFRASFLQRTGVLGIRTGSWLLQVERQPYDLVLDRFSWSWAWVKFPWMSEPLTVEW
jgi:hypothetical protein